MNQNQNKSINTLSLLLKFLLTSAISLFAMASYAAADGNNVMYTDSIHSWGAWELDIEPAAGGIQPPATGALNARDSKVKLRANSIAALAPRRPTTPVVTHSPTPIVPVAPPATPVPPPVIPPTIPGPGIPTTFAPPGATPGTTFTPPTSP